MNFLDLIKDNQNVDIQDYYFSLSKNIIPGYNDGFIKKIDYVLNYLSSNNDQFNLVKNKFKVINRGELYDVIAELCVFFDHLKEKPLFIKECKEETPDIKMDNSKFIEIKRVRLSNDQIYLLDLMLGKTKEERDIIFSSKEKALKIKIEDKIDKALSQMNDKKGFVYIIYSLDINMQGGGVSNRMSDFEMCCNDYFNSKDISGIVLKVVFLNNILDFNL